MPQIDAGRLIPPQASDAAPVTDGHLLVLLTLSGATLLLVLFLVTYFGLRYRAGARRPLREPRSLSLRVEVGWATALVLIAVALFAMGATRMLTPRKPPMPSRTVYIVGKQWMWKAQHPEGRREINELHLAAGEPVRLLLTSQDVIHSFYVPAFRLKQDLLPDRFTSLTFTPTRPGVYSLRCAEYCGSKHSGMLGVVIVQEPDRHQRWLSPGAEAAEGRPFMPMADEGMRVFARFGCGACHMREATPMAPRLDGLYGGQSRMTTGELVVADENYIRESILRPNARIVAGYPSPSPMPSYQGQVTEEDLTALVEMLRSIRHGWPTPEGGP